jgi:Uma2 family endonuclease
LFERWLVLGAFAFVGAALVRRRSRRQHAWRIGRIHEEMVLVARGDSVAYASRMVAASPFVEQACEPDRRFVVESVPWSAYEHIREALDEANAGIRLTYLEGVLELMSPSRDHEAIAKLIARLVEAFAEERDLSLNGYKSSTFRKQAGLRGLEPDECYSLGPLGDVPDIAIEVVLSSGLVDKLEVYRGLVVPEVWVFRSGTLAVYRLDSDGAYRTQGRSELLPDLDIRELASFVSADADQTSAVRAYRAKVRAART